MTPAAAFSSRRDDESEPIALGRGALCISIDLELAWGTWDTQTDEGHQLCAIHERAVVDRLLELFARHDVPVTWATVGRLLDEGDAHGRRGGAQNWYAPEVVDAIRAAHPRHEIGSHSYAHVYFAALSPEDADRDLANARRVHDRAGLPFRSFVFPRNQVGHIDLLPKHGIAVFRSVDAGRIHDLGRALPPLRALTNFADKLLPISPVVVLPRRHPNGLVELETSLLLMSRRGPRRFLSPGLWLRRMRSALADAAAERAIFHLWFHPSNFYFDADTQLAILDDVLTEATAMRSSGRLDVRTMGEFAAKE